MSTVFMVASDALSTARTREANARSASPVCLAYSQGLPSLPGTLTAEVLTQFSEELCGKWDFCFVSVARRVPSLVASTS